MRVILITLGYFHYWLTVLAESSLSLPLTPHHHSQDSWLQWTKWLFHTIWHPAQNRKLREKKPGQGAAVQEHVGDQLVGGELYFFYFHWLFFFCFLFLFLVAITITIITVIINYFIYIIKVFFLQSMISLLSTLPFFFPIPPGVRL